jgi:hypothetical protein
MSNDPESIPKRQRKGIYEELLCEDCERKLRDSEDYAAKVLNGGVLISLQQLPDRILVGNIDYAKFKLFQLSILWRSSVSKRPEIPKLNLGPHQEILRRMLYNNEPGNYFQYACFVSYIPEFKDMMQRMVFPLEPLNRRIQGFHIYRGVFGGLFWAFMVSSHNNLFPYKEAFLSEEGLLPIFHAPPSGNDFMFNIGKEFAHTINKTKTRTV